MTDAEMKLTNIKCTLLQEIATAKRQIHHHILQGARLTRERLQANKKANEDVVTLSKVEYDAILNYLLSVERDSMQNFENNQYLSNYYHDIKVKTDILNQL